MEDVRIIEVKQSVFEDNNRDAATPHDGAQPSAAEPD